MQYWLVKTEPDAFGWDQQVANGVEPWTGVRSHQAKNNLAAMRKGDRAFFYHSNIGKEIVGIVEVAREAYPDPSAESGDWVCVDMRAVGPMPRPVTLAEIKADPALKEMALVRYSRLSVGPVTAEEWQHILELGGWRGRKIKDCPSYAYSVVCAWISSGIPPRTIKPAANVALTSFVPPGFSTIQFWKMLDLRHDYGEVRITAIGAVEEDVLVVTYTDRGDVRRIISARPANRKERRRWLSFVRP